MMNNNDRWNIIMLDGESKAVIERGIVVRGATADTSEGVDDNEAGLLETESRANC